MITEFLKPKTIIEAVQLKQATPDAVYMAGGSWINSSRSAMNPETVISLNELDLNFIKQDQDTLRIGAMTTLQDILDNDLIPDYIKDNLKLFRNRNIRNQGTLAGAIATKNPAFSILTVLIAAGARLETPTEEISVEKYVTSDCSALILAVRIPLKAAVCSNKHSITARGVSLVSVAAGVFEKQIYLVVAQDGGKIERLTDLEIALNGDSLPDRDELAEKVSKVVASFDDYRTSAAFKKYIAGVMLADCLIKAAKGV